MQWHRKMLQTDIIGESGKILNPRTIAMAVFIMFPLMTGGSGFFSR